MRRSVACVPALLVAVVLSSCQAETKTAEPKVVRVTPTPQPPPPGSGRFYVEAGANDLAADLYEMRFSPLDFQRLTKDARVTTISGCDRAIIVAAAQKEVGYADRLQAFRDGRLQPIDGLGRPPASDPHVAPDCRILYYEQTGTSDALVGEIRLWDPVEGSTTTLESGDPDILAGATWGPAGAIAVLRRQPGGAKVTVVRPNGSRTDIDPKMPNAGNTQWGATGWLALGQLPIGGGEMTGTVFVNPATGERQSQPGWAPLVWSPDGTKFLVSKADDRTRLGVVEVADLKSVREVGTSTVGPIWDAVWLAA
ncbi:MAG: hypothetical protein ACRD0D_02305 [Acidimicrobiales bacterium]